MQDRRKKFDGVVVSKKMEKTAVVLVERMVWHPLLKKSYKMKRRFMVHDEKGISRVGDIVRIMECRPISKRKRFTIVANLTRAGNTGVTNDTKAD